MRTLDVFCENRKDSIDHYVRECKVKVWFRKLGSEEGDILGKLWRENLNRLKGEIY